MSFREAGRTVKCCRCWKFREEKKIAGSKGFKSWLVRGGPLDDQNGLPGVLTRINSSRRSFDRHLENIVSRKTNK